MFSNSLKCFLIMFCIFFMASCSNSLEEKRQKLDKIYGPCDNPSRPLSDLERDICLSKLRGAGPDGKIPEAFSITDFLSGARNNSVVFQGYNQALWQSSLYTLNKYPIKSSDVMGGYIETDWIYESSDPTKRCLIKVQITSTELISTGISSSFLCQTKTDSEWVGDNKDYIDEARKLNLKILDNTKNFIN